MRNAAKTRSCCGCMRRANKTELLRVVRTKDGRVTADPDGNIPGRGAYLCKSTDCLNMAIRKKRLPRVLRTAVPEEVYQAVEQLLTQSK